MSDNNVGDRAKPTLTSGQLFEFRKRLVLMLDKNRCAVQLSKDLIYVLGASFILGGGGGSLRRTVSRVIFFSSAVLGTFEVHHKFQIKTPLFPWFRQVYSRCMLSCKLRPAVRCPFLHILCAESQTFAPVSPTHGLF